MMWNNEAGHEFDLKVPLPNGQILYTSFMPSVLSFMRNMGSGVINLAQGRNDIALQKAATLFSMPVAMASQVISNKDYFGRPIWQVTDDYQVKATKAIEYMGLGVTHPYFSELYKYFQGKQDIYQTISTMTELPIKFSTTDKAAVSDAYVAKQAATEANTRLLNEAKSEWSRLKESPDADTFNAEYDKIAKDNPQLAAKITQIYKEEKLGLTSKDIMIKQLGVANGSRAKYIVSQLKLAKNEADFNAKWDDYKKKGLITNEVAKQINQLWK
jgi:hypothetical protein